MSERERERERGKRYVGVEDKQGGKDRGMESKTEGERKAREIGREKGRGRESE